MLDTVVSNEGWDELKAMLIDATVEKLAQLPEAQKAQIGDLEAYAAQVLTPQIAMLQSPWYRFFIAYDPAKDLAKIQVPVLAIFGGLDLQVPAEANAEAVRERWPPPATKMSPSKSSPMPTISSRRQKVAAWMSMASLLPNSCPALWS